jgi:hypothetical protein
MEKKDSASKVQPLTKNRSMVMAVPENWTQTFGKPFYIHEQSLSALAAQSEDDWKLRMQGQLYETGTKINVTGFDELRRFILHELSTVTISEGHDG